LNSEVKRTVLTNGLTILTKEVHQVPLATVWAWYRVGARNEVPGITGISHWVEHMLFKGTRTFGKGEIFRSVTRNGGVLNGFTWLDFTTYFETLPSDHLDLGLRIEADRMVNSVFDPEEVHRERTVIISEREGNENSPSFLLSEEVAAAAFKVHPYGQGVIGFKSDLHAITRDDLINYYHTYYVPNNAILVVVGNFETSQVLTRVGELFGSIEAAPWVPPVRPVEPPQTGERRVVVRQPGGAKYFEAVFHAPPATSEDAYPLIILDAVLSGGKSLAITGGGRARMGRSSRLYRSLVDSELAASATSSFSLTRDPYLFSIWALLRENVPLEDVEKAAFEELARLRQEEVTDEEFERATKQVKAQFVYGSESVTDQAYWMGSMETIGVQESLGEFLAKVEQVSKADVQRVAQKYLTSENSTVGWFVPSNGRGAYRSEEAGGTTGDAGGPRFFVPAAFQSGPPSSSGIALRIDRQALDNGIVVLGHESHDSPLVVIRANLLAGSAMETDQQQGLARFTASMLIRGTQNRTFESLNEETDSAGMSLGVASGWQSAQISAKCLKEDFDHMVEILADVLRNPTFPPDQIEKVRGQMLTTLREQANDTGAVAERQFHELIYPAGHPYHRWPSGREDVVSSIKREDLVDFYHRAYRPAICTIAIAGDISFEAAVTKLRETLADWRMEGEAPSVELPPVSAPRGIERRVVDVPGKTQADLVMGLPSLSRRDPQYYALNMANLILGRLGLMGRLGAKVRDELGLAYYARSELEAGLWISPWSVSAGVNPRNVNQAIDAILLEIKRIQTELVSDAELADAKSFLIGSMPVSLEVNDGMARTIMEIEIYGLGLDYLERYPQIVASLTKEQVRDAAKRYFSAENLGLVIAGPPVA